MVWKVGVHWDRFKVPRVNEAHILKSKRIRTQSRLRSLWTGCVVDHKEAKVVEK